MRTNAAIREAAVRLFYAHGYKATSIRAIANEVGIQVSSIYNHINSKDELLAEIMLSVMDELLDSANAVLDGVVGGAPERLKAIIDFHIRYHAEHAREVFIGNSELRSLSGGDLEKVLARRVEYEQLLIQLVDDLAKNTGADVLDAKMQAYSILAQGAHVASWYKPQGSKSLDDTVEIYITMTLRQLGIDGRALR
ncbi:TetR/AcrR family transcriptional regulator [Nocardia sp. NPDC051990]|uniref:TetR/AcrR family transcriptional regulator n=1 Tax=Nocardia sp. NPDC051990 TaxID=3155285 RepID=UPI00343F1C96